MHRLIKSKASLGAVFVLVGIVCVSILAPLVAPYNPLKLDPLERLIAPSREHVFGTDAFGRDILSRVIFGSRLSMLIGASVVVVSILLGVPVGVIAGYYVRIGAVVMRVVDGLMAFPPIILALSFMAIWGPGLMNVVIAIGLVYFPRVARLVYALTRQVKENDYVISAHAIGARNSRILCIYIVLNLLSPIIVQATFTFAFAILNAAALDFLGVGVPPYIPSWGAIVSEGRIYITRAPWIVIFPGIAIILSVLSLNLVGDSLRDALDPRLRHNG